MSKYFMFLAALASVAVPALSRADTDAETNNGKRYIKLKTYWSDMTSAERQNIVQGAAKAMNNEIAKASPQINKVSPTLANALLDPKIVDQSVAEMERFLDSSDVKVDKDKTGLQKAEDFVKRYALPRAFLFTYGVSGAGTFALPIGPANGKMSMDFGVVVMLPYYETEYDTADRDGNNQPTIIENDKLHFFDTTVVGVPHAYAGYGVALGGTTTVGIAGIWGNMSSASDFYGAYAGGSGAIQSPIPLSMFFAIPVVGPFLASIPEGGDLDLGVVVNTNHVFAQVRLSADKGAEAQANADFEGGGVIPWHALVVASDFTVGKFSEISSWVSNLFSSKKSSSSDDEDNKNDSKTPGAPIKPNGNL